jgi:hypothetical protein
MPRRPATYRPAIGAIILAGTGSALLNEFFPLWVALIASVLFALGWMIRYGASSAFVLFVTFFAIGTSGIIVSVTQPYALLGSSSAPVRTVSEAAQTPWQQIFRFSDAVVQTQQAIPYQVVNQRSGTTRTTHWIAPLTAATATTTAPVHFWAVAPANSVAQGREQWAQPHQAALRLNAATSWSYRQVLANASPNPIFVRWTANPEAELFAAYGRVVLTIAIVVLVWGGVVAVDTLKR